jgi:hypothetical protein
MTICMLCVLLGSAPDAEANAAPRPLFEINRNISALFQREARAATPQERAAATFEMTRLYRDILEDPRYDTSPSLQEYRARLWSRLTRIKKEIQARIRAAGGTDRGAGELDDAQWLAAAQLSQSVGDQLALVGAALGGPAGVFSQVGAPGGAALPPDYGPALVDLIQRTIQPGFWDVYGGPGTIVYYRPLHCLVVRATSDVHHRVGSTLGALRAAGR